jgi:bacterioferritin (cytochrome b1)
MSRKKASFTSFLFGLLFGIVAVIGALFYGGYWVYNNLSVNEFERLSGQKLDFIAEESIFRTKVIKDLISEAQQIPELTFAEFYSNYGIKLPAEVDFVYEALGDLKIKELSVNHLLERVKIGYVLGSPYNDFEYTGEMPEDAEALIWEIRGCTIMGESGIQAYIDTLTVGSLKNIFGFELPSMLNIGDDVLISEMGAEIDNMTVASFLDGVFDEGTLTDPLISNIVNTLKTMTKDDGSGGQRLYKMSEFGELFNALPENLLIKDIIEEPDEGDTTPIAAVLRKVLKDPDSGDYYTIAQINTVFGNLGNVILLSDIITEPEPDDNSPIANIKRKVLKDSETGIYYTLNQANDVFGDLGNDILLKDIIDEPEDGDNSPIANILRKIIKDEEGNYYTINEMNSVFDNLGDTILLKDIINEPEEGDNTPVSNILRKILKDEEGNYYTINEMNSVFDNLGDTILLKDIINEPEEGDNTPVSNILRKILKDEEGNYNTLNEINEVFDNLSGNLLLKDIITEPEEGDNSPSAKILRKILKDGEGNYYTLDQVDDVFTGLPETLTLQDVMDEPEQGSNILGNIFYKLWNDNVKISEIGNLGDSNYELSDVLIDSGGDTVADKIIRFLREGINPDTGEKYKLSELNDAFNDVTVGTLFTSPAILCIFDPGLKLSELDTVNVDAVLEGKTMGELKEAGIISDINPNLESVTFGHILEKINEYWYLFT